MAKVEAAHLSATDQQIQKTQAALNEYDFIRFTTADMNGVLRGDLLPRDSAAKLLKSGRGCFAGLQALSPTMGVLGVMPTQVRDGRYGNVLMVPDLSTLHAVPWVNKYRVGQFMTETYWDPTTPQEACTRNMARRMLSKLDNMRLKFYSGVELEFVLINQETQLPVFSDNYFKSMLAQAEYESWFYDVASNVKKAGVDVGAMHLECNPAEFEFTTQPKFGIKAADGALILKQGIKEMAIQRGWHANFMAVPFHKEQVGCGHFNFSVWDQASGRNAFWDDTTEDNISELGTCWIAGMIHHAKALTALCNITTNCYRALHTAAVPHQANWGIEDRTAMLRVVNNGPEGTYIENRLPSSLCNPYLVMAATIAAGIDGVVRKLPCPVPHDVSEAAVELPHSLNEALECLQDDAVMVDALGETFVKWFVHCKTEADLKIIEGVTDFGELLELERKEYEYVM